MEQDKEEMFTVTLKFKDWNLLGNLLLQAPLEIARIPYDELNHQIMLQQEERKNKEL